MPWGAKTIDCDTTLAPAPSAETDWLLWCRIGDIMIAVDADDAPASIRE
nr:hypothetical protein [Rhodovulum sp. ES.010]